MTKHPKQACCKKKAERITQQKFRGFEFTDMPVCFRTRLCEYRNRGWTYVTTSFFGFYFASIKSLGFTPCIPIIGSI